MDSVIVKMMSRAATVVLLAGLAATGGGCQGGGGLVQGIGTLTGSEDATGREALVWDVPFTNIDPPSVGRTKVYVQFSDASGRGVVMRDELRTELTRQGYALEQDPYKADYRLEVTIRSFDRVARADSRDGTSHRLSGASDAIVTNSGRQAGMTGPVLGVGADLIGGLFGESIANSSTAKTWAMVADVKLLQLVPGGVESEGFSNRDSHGKTWSGAGNAGGGSRGESSASSGLSQRVSGRKTHMEYVGTLTAYSSRWGQSQVDQAKSAILPRLLSALAAALPSAR